MVVPTQKSEISEAKTKFILEGLDVIKKIDESMEANTEELKGINEKLENLIELVTKLVTMKGGDI